MQAMFAILNRPSSIVDGRLALPSPASASSGLAVELRDVTFAYGARTVLRGVSVAIAPGESVGVVGESGSGKSTLLKLLLRMYDPQSGSVLLEGVDARQLSLASLRAAVAVVPQDCVLFNATLASNIAYGAPQSSLAEIEAAAAAAQLSRTLTLLPAGLQTVVGERGVKLSGGEKQRVALARAFLRAPRLLVSDEATSALDSASEAGILASLREIAAGRTSVTVAHRLSTVRHCDRILVMRDGVIVEEGSHDALMALDGLYTSMWSKQADVEREVELTAAEADEGALLVAR
jgi:ABC-type multidrug transport system fused ATPase/permease subunit